MKGQKDGTFYEDQVIINRAEMHSQKRLEKYQSKLHDTEGRDHGHHEEDGDHSESY